jgi:hypothetical protein
MRQSLADRNGIVYDVKALPEDMRGTVRASMMINSKRVSEASRVNL